MNVRTMTGKETFICSGKALSITVEDFWAWNSSNLLSNTLRGALAEYIVATALNLDLTFCRNDWTDFDLTYGLKKIEVKSSAYLQAWDQQHLSEIRFSIAPSRSWTSAQHYNDIQSRHSDLYIFCLYKHKERASANPLCLDQWDFFVLPTEAINKQLGNQKSLSLKSLLALNPISTKYAELKKTVDTL